MRTTTELLGCSFVTRTSVPNGRVLWAAVSAWVLNFSPLAVRLPWKPGPYQEAAPLWSGLASAAEMLPSAHPRTTPAMARRLEGLVMLSGLPLMQCTIQHIASQQKRSSITRGHGAYVLWS